MMTRMDYGVFDAVQKARTREQFLTEVFEGIEPHIEFKVEKRRGDAALLALYDDELYPNASEASIYIRQRVLEFKMRKKAEQQNEM